MRRPAVLLALSCLLAARAPLASSSDPQPSSQFDTASREARERLKTASPTALREAAERLEALAGAAIPGNLVEGLKKAAADLRAAAAPPAGQPRKPFDPAPFTSLLDRVDAALRPGAPLGLSFEGSYAQSKVAEPVYGGHASAMGPAPEPAPSSGASTPSPATFVAAPDLPTRTYCGGPTKNHILESGGSGLALFDYDGDGLLDVYLVNAYELSAKRERIPHKNALYRNLGGFHFEDVSAKAGVDAAAWGSGVCAGDFDDDGRLDLYVTNWGKNLLYRNDGNGTFADVAERAGVAASGWSTGCAFFDADADGDLDLYVARYVQATWDDVTRAERTLTWRGGPKVMVGPTGLPGEADLFFENRGDGTFAEATESRGLQDTNRGYGFGVLASDYDDDGKVDLFVANDSTPNFLYHNLGGGRFESAGLLSGVAVNADGRAQAGMGVDAGDYDGDGRLDFVLTTFAHDAKTLYRNLGQSLFEDASRPTGVAAATFDPMGWGVAFMDADLDGVLDLFIANGHIYPDVDAFPALKESFRQTSQLLLNDKGVFRDVSATAGAGLQVRKSARGMAVGDLDGDGDLDVVISNVDDTPTVLENRQATGRHWAAFRVLNPGKNRFAIGAKVTVEARGRRQIREVRSGGSYLSQNTLDAHFGLGNDGGAVDVEVRMPGGARWRWSALPADRLHVLKLTDDRRVN